MRKLPAWLGIVLLLFSGGIQGDAQAQAPACAAADLPHWDVRTSVSIYCADTPVPELATVADRVALPLFLGAPVASGVYALNTQSQSGFDAAYRLGLSMTGAYAVTFSLKRIIRRPRPYAAGLVPRRDRHATPTRTLAPSRWMTELQCPRGTPPWPLPWPPHGA